MYPRQEFCINLAINGASLSSLDKNSSHRFHPSAWKTHYTDCCCLDLGRCLKRFSRDTCQYGDTTTAPSLYKFDPSHLTRDQWVVIALDLPRAKPDVHPHSANLGTIFDALFNDASAASIVLIVLSGASFAENFLINNLKM